LFTFGAPSVQKCDHYYHIGKVLIQSTADPMITKCPILSSDHFELSQSSYGALVPDLHNSNFSPFAAVDRAPIENVTKISRHNLEISFLRSNEIGVCSNLFSDHSEPLNNMIGAVDHNFIMVNDTFPVLVGPIGSHRITKPITSMKIGQKPLQKGIHTMIGEWFWKIFTCREFVPIRFRLSNKTVSLSLRSYQFQEVALPIGHSMMTHTHLNDGWNWTYLWANVQPTITTIWSYYSMFFSTLFQLRSMRTVTLVGVGKTTSNLWEHISCHNLEIEYAGPRKNTECFPDLGDPSEHINPWDDIRSVTLYDYVKLIKTFMAFIVIWKFVLAAFQWLNFIKHRVVEVWDLVNRLEGTCVKTFWKVSWSGEPIGHSDTLVSLMWNSGIHAWS